LGQSPFFPPNVKGWEGGRTWINSSTLLGRINLVRRLTSNKDAKFAGVELGDLVRQHGKGAEERVNWLLDLLLAVPVPDEARASLIELAESATGDENKRASALIQGIGALPEFQLC
jgi:hypothetical protein